MFNIVIKDIDKVDEEMELSRLGYSHWWRLCDSYALVEVISFGVKNEILMTKEELPDALDKTISFLKDLDKSNIVDKIFSAYKEYKNNYDK